MRKVAVALFLLLNVMVFPKAARAEEWGIVLGPTQRDDKAVALAINDLQSAGSDLGIQFSVYDPNTPLSGHRIVLGDASRNPLAETTAKEVSLKLLGVRNPQGFEIRSGRIGNDRVIVIAGGAIEGDVYGLYWLWDRLRVFKEVPDLNLVRAPAFSIRSGGGPSQGAMRDALRFTVNWTTSADTNALVPYDVEPLATENAQHRSETQPLIDYAHALHMKFFTVADEFSYLPDVLATFDATTNPDDDALWDMLQDKYRRLLTAMPGIDGVRIRTGELTRVVEPWKPYDVMHEPEVPDWPLERRYRTFVQKMHEVVVGEFDKLYYHRTWVTGSTEQHSNADVYRAIFTGAVPTKNLYLSPYLTRGDRWFYQPINPTFNLTPHKMLVLLASMNYHEGGSEKIFPTYPGLYFQKGFDKLWRGQDSNIVGSQFGSASGAGWGSGELTVYTAFRMSWDPLEDPRTIAEDFASIHFGRKTAQTMGEVIMLSGDAYRHGLYIKPVAESVEWNTLPHLRLTTFVLRGFPAIDRGKEHIQWLHDTMYVPSKPHKEEALAYLLVGHYLVEHMQALGEKAKPLFDDPNVASHVMDSLELARALIATNHAYVKTCFAYFDYREQRTDEFRSLLAAELDRLDSAVAEFRAAPGFGYKLYGIDQFRINARDALDDLDAAEAKLAAAPDPSEVSELILAHQEKDKELVVARAEDAVKVLHWKGMVDGKDILKVQRDQVAIEHIAADPIHSDTTTFFAPLPARAGTVFLRDMQSGEIHPFVLQQPNAENNYTAEIYFFDPGPGYTVWELELYFLDEAPEAVGVDTAWEE